MKILMVAVESRPYANVGGTGDVVGALSEELRRKGHDVRIALPYYSTIIPAPRYSISHVMNLAVPVGGETVPASVYEVDRSAYFIGDDPDGYFARVDNQDVPLYPALEDRRAGKLYTFFGRAVVEMVSQLCQDEEAPWKPDVIHCHDWHTGLIPVYLRQDPRYRGVFEDVKVVFTVHNISDAAYQGVFQYNEVFPYAGLPATLFVDGLLEHDQCVNFMKAGIVFSDKVSTVSEEYAQEIRSSRKETYVRIDGERRSYQYSGGLHYLWPHYHVHLIGIRNGIDDSYDPNKIGQGVEWEFVDEDWRANWIPAGGRSISRWAYSIGDPRRWQKKADLKKYLQDRCNRHLDAEFEVRGDIPVIAVRSRLAEQKGFDLIIEGLKRWEYEHAVQFIIIAWGGDPYAELCKSEYARLAKEHPDRVAFASLWKPVPEPLHYAAADLLLMPSLFEPCGLPHMMALRYGTIPVVRRTGGLADVVAEFDPATGTGNGFLFDDPDYGQMNEAIERALQIYRNPGHWEVLRASAIQARDTRGWDFTWDTAVERYLDDLYS